MMDLAEFFDGMSKPMLRDVHAQAFGKKGLLNNALIQSEVLSFYSSNERLQSIRQKLEPWQRHCLEREYGRDYGRMIVLEDNSVAVMRILDTCRANAGYRFPFEE